MKNKLFIVLLISAMLMSPAAVFAENVSGSEDAAILQNQDLQAASAEQNVLNDAAADSLNDEAASLNDETVSADAVSEEPAYEGEDPKLIDCWDATRTYYYDSNGNQVSGLFKAPMKGHESEPGRVLRLYYFDPSTHKVVNQTKMITVGPGSGAKKNARFVYSESADGYVTVSDSDTKSYSYFIQRRNDGDCYIVSTQGLYKSSTGTYMVGKNGTVTTANGFGYYTNSGGKTVKVYIHKNGTVRTNSGWIRHNGKKYLIQSGGAVYTPSAITAHKVGNNSYIFYTNGSIRTKVGIYKIKSTGKRYYVKSKKGMLAKNKTVKLNKGKKVYHTGGNCVVKVGRHKWKDGKYYYSTDKGYLTRKSLIVKTSKGRFFAKKGGLIACDQKVRFNGKYYIANKKGYFKTGMFTWHKSLYYASKAGVLKVKKGIFEYKGNSYYIGNGGVIHRNGQFKEGGKIYMADKDGILAKGMYLWKGYYYLADDNYVTITQEGIRYLNNKYYYIAKGTGRFAKNQFVTYKKKHYYAGSDSAIITSTFTYAGVTITPSRMGEITDTDYYRVFPDEKPKDNDDDKKE